VEDTTIVTSSTAGKNGNTHSEQAVKDIADKAIVDKEIWQTSLAM
jgi:hypothetical protein